MNKTYSLVWNEALGAWTVVGEHACRRGKKSRGGKRAIAAAVSLLGLVATGAHALPTGANIASGKADILTSGDGKAMSVNQHSDKLITNWQDFSIAGGERVSFYQPSNKSIALNRVIGQNGSDIQGQLEANGKVFLVNPNGVVFGKGAQVNVGGLVASTQNVSDEDFLAGNYRFAGKSLGSVVNEGRITAAEGGSVALLGAQVSNRGTIQAKMGRVVLGAGNAFKVNFDGNDLLSLQVEDGAVNAQAHNGGLLQADGGEVLMTARAAGNLLDAVVNNTGKIEARGLNAHGGKITLDGGTVKVAGTLDASAAESGAPAGLVTTRGERVDVAIDAVVDTRAGNTAGKWAIEAANAGVNGTNVAGKSIDADTLSRNLGTTNVELASTQGDLTVGGPVAWDSDNALTLTSKQGNVDLQQTLSASGTNASLLVNAANQIRVNDAVKLTGRNAHLDLNATNGDTFTNDKALVTLSGDNASFRSNGEDYKVLHTLADLRNVDQNLHGRYVLGNAIDGYNASFRSIGSGQAFFGVFNGLGNTISRLNVTNPGQNVVGLFAVNNGEIANLALQNIQTSGTAQRYGSPLAIGTLAGFNLGAIRNVSAKDVSVTARGRTFIGGLVGDNISGAIERSSVSGRVEGDRDTLAIGGLVGENVAVIWPKIPAARISDSRAEVRVVTGGSVAGGLAGFNHGVIERSSSAGSVVATGRNARVGGLVAVNDGIVTGSSSSATVTAGQNAVAGGLVGENAGNIAHSDASGAVNVGNQSIAGGLVGTNGGNIDDSHAYGNVIAETSGTAGGFAGSNTGRIARSDASGSVKAGPSSRAGGFAAINEGVIDRATAAGAVLAGANSVAGGLVGQNTGKVVNAKARGDVTVAGKATIGGLAGTNEGVIDASTAEGLVTAGNESTAGGLVGFNTGVVKQSSATGYVLAGHSSKVGGLVGRSVGKVVGSEARGNVKAGNLSDAGGLIGANDSGSVSGSYAYGDVEAGADSWVGGLVGHLRGTVDASHATGSAKGGDSSRVGGLIGRNDGTVKDSSSTGTVSGGRQAHLGGLVGGNFGYVNKSSTSSQVAFTNGYNQQYGALAGVNFRMLAGNKVSGNAAGLPLVGFNAGTVQD